MKKLLFVAVVAMVSMSAFAGGYWADHISTSDLEGYENYLHRHYELPMNNKPVDNFDFILTTEAYTATSAAWVDIDWYMTVGKVHLDETLVNIGESRLKTLRYDKMMIYGGAGLQSCGDIKIDLNILKGGEPNAYALAQFYVGY